MRQYCPVCFREISTTTNGKIHRHGFERNKWKIIQNIYIKVDGSPCKGTGQFGLTEKQIIKNNKK